MRPLGIHPAIAAGGAHFGPFSRNSAILSGAPLAGRIWGRSQSTPEHSTMALPTGFATGGGTSAHWPPYVPRREFLDKRDTFAPTPDSSDAPSKAGQKNGNLRLIAFRYRARWSTRTWWKCNLPMCPRLSYRVRGLIMAVIDSMPFWIEPFLIVARVAKP